MKSNQIKSNQIKSPVTFLTRFFTGIQPCLGRLWYSGCLF